MYTPLRPVRTWQARLSSTKANSPPWLSMKPVRKLSALRRHTHRHTQAHSRVENSWFKPCKAGLTVYTECYAVEPLLSHHAVRELHR
jgi:hypothetical protein